MGNKKVYIDDDLASTAYRLHDLFSRTDDPLQVVEAMKKIIEQVNIVDPNEPENSIWRNRPLRAVLDDTERMTHAETLEKDQQLEKIRAKLEEHQKNGTLPTKDWAKMMGRDPESAPKTKTKNPLLRKGGLTIDH